MTTARVTLEIDLEDLVEELSGSERVELAEHLKEHGLPVDHLVDESDGVTAEAAYYAFVRGDMETVRRFVCAAAGRIA